MEATVSDEDDDEDELSSSSVVLRNLILNFIDGICDVLVCKIYILNRHLWCGLLS